MNTKEFARSLVKKWCRKIGAGFHPDTPGSEYQPPLSQEDATQYDMDIAVAHFVLKEEMYEVGADEQNALLGPTFVKEVRAALSEHLAEQRRSCSFGDGLEDDYIWDGMNMVGLNNMTDTELAEEAGSTVEDINKAVTEGQSIADFLYNL